MSWLITKFFYPVVHQKFYYRNHQSLKKIKAALWSSWLSPADVIQVSVGGAFFLVCSVTAAPTAPADSLPVSQTICNCTYHGSKWFCLAKEGRPWYDNSSSTSRSGADGMRPPLSQFFPLDIGWPDFFSCYSQWLGNSHYIMSASQGCV